MEGLYSRYFSIGATRKIICAAKNYHPNIADPNFKPPGQPMWFDKPLSSAVLPGESLKWQPSYNNVNHEIELGVVIGMSGRNISE